MIVTDAALGEFLAGSIDWTTDTFDLVLVDATPFTPDSTPMLSDLDPASIIGTATIAARAISGRTATAGVTTITGVAAGRTVAGIWVMRNSGVSSTSRLVCFTDRNDDATPISYLTTGADITVEFTPYVFSI